MFDEGKLKPMSLPNFSEATATIRMIGQEMDNSEIPAPILVRTITGLQKVIYLLAASQEKQDIGQRFRISDQLQQFYTLRCQIPQPGSYTLPLTLKPSPESQNSQTSIFSDYEKIIDNLSILLDSLCQENLTKIQELLPDSKLRNRVLREFRKFTPKAGENWQLGFSSPRYQEILVTENTNDYIDEWLNLDIPEDETMTVTGELISINFDQHTVVIKYPPTHREIQCIYLEELEDSLIENRRQLIQVTGKFTLDSEGHPTKLTDVTRIDPIDLSSILLKEINDRDRKLIFKNPLRLLPIMDEESRQLYVVEYPNIGLHVFSYTRDELIHEINEQILMNWDEYAKEDAGKLAKDAQQIRINLLELIKEESYA